MKPGANVIGRSNSRTMVFPSTRNELLSKQSSLPAKSSSPNDQQLFKDSVDFIPASEANRSRSFRPRSAVLSSSSLSGLPSLSGKGAQHPYILRKGSQRKGLKSTSSLSQSMSPDLISVSCDEIVRMAEQGEEANRRVSFDQNSEQQVEKKTDTSLIDFGEDCLDGGRPNDEVDSISEIFDLSSLNRLNSNGMSEIPTLRRTLSDALIIPDPFEREPDETLSPDSNLNLDNILV